MAPPSADPNTTAAPSVALEARAVSKAYGSVQALSEVDLVVRRGSVHGLVGENGSGKSTLTKILAGVVKPDHGSVAIDGRQVEGLDPRHALHLGVRVIFQDLALFPNMTVAENLTFEGDAPLLSRVKGGQVRKRARAALDRLRIDVDPLTRVGELSTAERQLVAIARAVSSDGRIILMDEPTAALTQSEIDGLLETIGSLSDEGLSFVFISHKLREVVSISDDVTVLRNGEVVASDAASAFDQERIGLLMTGGAVHNEPRIRPARAEAPAVLEARGLTLGRSFADIDLTLHEGQVVGLAGLVGSGRTAIGLALVGLIRCDAGEVWFKGEPATSLRTLDDLQYVPEDRLTEGLILDWSIADNIVLKTLDETLDRRRLVDGERIRDLGNRWRDRLSIKAPSVDDAVDTLSGGNQQRVLLARTLAPAPSVVVLNNPTVGVDIGSRADIHDRIRSVADDGTAVLVISDEPAELLSVCDEIHVVHEGRIVERRDATDLEEEALLDLISRKEVTA
jgi:simple sugar transport system ATP-binding protein